MFIAALSCTATKTSKKLQEIPCRVKIAEDVTVNKSDLKEVFLIQLSVSGTGEISQLCQL